MITARFVCTRVEKTSIGVDVELEPVNSKNDAVFGNASPSGHITLHVEKESIFVVGKDFDVNFDLSPDNEVDNTLPEKPAGEIDNTLPTTPPTTPDNTLPPEAAPKK